MMPADYLFTGAVGTDEAIRFCHNGMVFFFVILTGFLGQIHI